MLCYGSRMTILCIGQVVVFQVGWSTHVLGPDFLKEDSALAEAFVSLARRFVAEEVRVNAWYHQRPPFCFLKSLSDQAEHHKEAMNFASQLWEVLNVFEPLADNDPCYKKALGACLWPESVFTREALVGAYECDFQRFPPEINRDLKDIARSMGTSQPCEMAHRVLGQAAKESINGRLGRITRWHRVMTASILEEMDRLPPRIGMAEKANVSQPMNNKFFDAKDCTSVFPFNRNWVATNLENDRAS